MCMWWRVLPVVLLIACSSDRHVVVRDTNVAPERRYQCWGGKRAEASLPCVDATEDRPGQDNAANTVFVAMPSQCKGRIEEVLVKNANTSTPTVFVRCAAPESAVRVVGPNDGGQ